MVEFNKAGTTKADRDESFDRRRKIVGVMGSSAEAHAELSVPAGRAIAELGCHLLTGGGSGVMEVTSRAFAETQPRAGLVIGVLRADGDAHLVPKDGRRQFRHRGLNDYVEIPVFTHLPESSAAPMSRNHINVLSADVVLVLPGSSGTLSELELAAEYCWTPLLLFLGDKTVGGMNADRAAALVAPEARIVESELELKAELSRALDL